jgi:hypothetical protein
MADAGGGVFLLFLVLVSLTLLAVWLANGSGSKFWKVKVMGVYLLVTIVPGLVAHFVGESGIQPTAMSNVSFVFGFLALLSGFIIPLIAKRFSRGSNT